MTPPVATETVFEWQRAGGAASVCVAVSLYNYARFLPECLDSVAAQTHAPLELIVVDDASQRDDSQEVARAWLTANRERFSRVLLLGHKRNQGLAQARNTAFAAARAPHVFVLDADNSLYPRAIERLHRAISGHDFAAAYSQLEFFGARQCLGTADVWDRARFQHGNTIDAMALVSKHAWQRVGGYTHLDGGWEDFDFWCKFIDHGLTAAFVPQILCRYRVHPSSMLRTEHLDHSAQLAVLMVLRHPWLQLGQG